MAVPLRERSLGDLLAVVGTASLASAFVAWVVSDVSAAVLDYHVSVWAFLLAWLGLVGYFSRLRFPVSMVGTGLLVVGFAVLLRPPLESAVAGALAGTVDPRPVSRVSGGLSIALGGSLRGRGKIRRIYEAFRNA